MTSFFSYAPPPTNQDQWAAGPFLSLPQKTRARSPLTSTAEDGLRSLWTVISRAVRCLTSALVGEKRGF